MIIDPIDSSFEFDVLFNFHLGVSKFNPIRWLYGHILSYNNKIAFQIYPVIGSKGKVIEIQTPTLLQKKEVEIVNL